VSSVFFIAAAVFAVGMAVLLLAVFGAAGRPKGEREGLHALDSAPQHLCYMGPMRQSLDPGDLRYVAGKGGPDLARRLRRDRRRVALLYLDAIQKDFEQLLRIARVVALLSPEISGMQEMERLRLALLFRVRFQTVKIRFLLGAVAIPQLTALGEMVTSLALRMETSVQELGERAALAAELALESDR
jgi:hypothetical protein